MKLTNHIKTELKIKQRLIVSRIKKQKSDPSINHLSDITQCHVLILNSVCKGWYFSMQHAAFNALKQKNWLVVEVMIFMALGELITNDR